jgi:hypothetical protein
MVAAMASFRSGFEQKLIDRANARLRANAARRSKFRVIEL